MCRSESFPSCQGCSLCILLWPRTLAADGSVYAMWPLATGCHTIDYHYYYYYYMTPTCAWMTKPSLAMRPTGLMEQRVLARDSGPSVTLEMVYSASSTCSTIAQL